MVKEIILKKLSLKNFKGIKELSIDFGKITNISGDNATGKTTIFDAFTWLLFDKDSQDRTAFEIKTLDSNNNVLHGLDHEVTGVLSVDSRTITLTKVYREKWTKKRGEAEKELTGHETLYYIDEVPVKKSEYQDGINSLFDEQLFKFISNPLYFSMNLKWQDRRKVLLDIIGNIDDQSVINYRLDLKLLEPLLVDKDIDTLKRSITARKRKLNEDIKAIPYRIDELNNSIQEMDFDALDLQRRGIMAGIKSIEDKILDKSKVNDELLKVKDRIYKLKSRIQEIENEAGKSQVQGLASLKMELMEIENKIKMDEYRLKNIQNQGTALVGEIEQTKQEINDLRKKWYEIDEKSLVFDEKDFVCPTCKRPFDESDIEAKKEQITENFNRNKAKELAEIKDRGTLLSNTLKSKEQSLKDSVVQEQAFERAISNLNLERQTLQSKIDNYIPEDTLSSNKEYADLKQQVEILEKSLALTPQSISDTMDFKEKKAELEAELEKINRNLATKEQNERFKQRIKELMAEEKSLAQQIAEFERQEYLTEEFVKTKVELLEGSINSKFKYVSFKLFDTQVNGGLVETCEALINGVPFSGANTAGQINAGMDIINALSAHYGVQAPIFIDNRESINTLMETDAQVINLIVAKLYGCKDCRTVSTNSKECPQCKGNNIIKFNHLKIESEEM